MIHHLYRRITVYSAIAAIAAKQFLAYRTWVWARLVGRIVILLIVVHFWRAVYSNTEVLGGLRVEQTINYIMLAEIILPVISVNLILDFGNILREGRIAIELTRPLDTQRMFYTSELSILFCNFVQQIVPVGTVAWLFFDLKLPSNLIVWICFAVSLLLGHAIIFLFDWIFVCLAFYTTELWGLAGLRIGMATFFSGALVPLSMFPDWLRAVANGLPFSQTLYVPVSILSGIIPLERVLDVWLGQVVWLVCLYFLSRLIFQLAVRKVTVQGG